MSALLVPVGAGSATTNWLDVDLGQPAAQSESLAAPQLVAVDGRRHAVFNRPNNGGLVYATCSARCDDGTSWTTTALPSEGRGLHLDLAVTAAGGPRLAWYSPTEEAVRFAVCDVNCALVSSWAVATVANVDDDVPGTGGGGVTISYDIGVSMALDSLGQPAIAYAPQGNPAELVYARCTANCKSPTNWGRVVLDTTADGGHVPGGPELTFHHDNPVLVFHHLVEGARPLITTCSRSCLDRTFWTTTEIDAPYITYGDLQFDGERAGLVYTTSKKRASSQQITDKWLVFVSCEQYCTEGPNWSPAVVFDDVGDRFTYSDYVTWSSGRYYHGAQRPQLRWVEGHARVTYASCVDCGLSSEESHVFLAACDGLCTQRSNWSVEDLDFTAPHGLAPAITGDGGSLHFLYTRHQAGESDGRLFLASCEGSCASVPPPQTPTTTTSTSTSTTTSTTTTTTTTTTTAPPPGNDPAHAPSTPVLLSPSNGASLYYGQPEKFTLRSSDPDGDPYKTIVVVRKATTGEVVATYESSLTVSGLETSVKPSGPFPPGSYEWAARSVDVNGLRSSLSAAARFTVQ